MPNGPFALEVRLLEPGASSELQSIMSLRSVKKANYAY